TISLTRNRSALSFELCLAAVLCSPQQICHHEIRQLPPVGLGSEHRKSLETVTYGCSIQCWLGRLKNRRKLPIFWAADKIQPSPPSPKRLAKLWAGESGQGNARCSLDDLMDWLLDHSGFFREGVIFR